MRPRRAQRPLWPVVLLALAVVVALSVTLVVVRRDDRPRAAVGQVFENPFQEEAMTHLGEVLLPWVRTEVGASRPHAELPAILGSRAPYQAPSGGSFVRVEIDDEGLDLPALSTVAESRDTHADVVLRADGRDYPLSTPGGILLDPDEALEGDRWVAVAGRPSDLEVRITLDGVTQVVDAADGSVDPGRAAALGDLPLMRSTADTDHPCGTPTRVDRTRLVLTRRGEPEVHGQPGTAHAVRPEGIGWAGDGREFLVLKVVMGPASLDLATRGDDRDTWDTDDVELTARLGDLAPRTPASDPTQLIFDVGLGDPLGDLTVDLVAHVSMGAPFVTARRDVRFRWTVTAGELA